MEENKVVTLVMEPTTEIPIYSDHSDTHVRRIYLTKVSRRVIKYAVDLRDGCKIDGCLSHCIAWQKQTAPSREQCESCLYFVTLN